MIERERLIELIPSPPDKPPLREIHEDLGIIRFFRHYLKNLRAKNLRTKK